MRRSALLVLGSALAALGCDPGGSGPADAGAPLSDAGNEAPGLDASRPLPPPPPPPPRDAGTDAAAPTPLWPDPTWTTRDPEAAGFDRAGLDAAAAYADSIDSRCLLVVRDGALVYERYFHGADPGEAAGTWSIAKTFTAALVGIAIAEGHLPSVDAPAAEYLPEWRGTAAEAITVRHLLAMTSGLRFDFLSDYSWTLFSDDMTADALALPVEDPPGSVWHYNNHAVQVLEAVLERATGEDVEAFARRTLWSRIGMGAPRWNRDPAGNVTTFMNVIATCRDLARFGLLLSRGGEWDGSRVIDPGFVAEMTRPSQALNRGYGWLVWVNADAPAYTAADEPFEGTILPTAPPETFSLQGFGQSFVDVIPAGGATAPDTIYVHVRRAPHDPPTRFLTDPGGTLSALLDDANRTEHRELSRRLMGATR